MQKIAYLNCQAGVSASLVLAALLDAGLSLDTLHQALTALPIQDYHLQLTPISERGVHGSQLDIVLTQEDQTAYTLSTITALLQSSTLPMRVREQASTIFRRLAEAEAAVEACAVEDACFSLLSVKEALVAIVGVLLALEILEVSQVYASPLPLTDGYVQTRQGLLPLPLPITLELLRQVHAPWKPSPLEEELVTPAGAALLATIARFEAVSLSIEQVGYGFGAKQLPHPHCVRLCLGYPYPALAQPVEDADTDWVAVIESHIDNMSGELLGGLMERLFSAGALDVSYTPLQMKKNRPATLVTIICPLPEGERLAMLMLRETSTLGVRIQQVRRLKAQRSQQSLPTPLGEMLVKVKRLGARIISAAPEYDECQRIAREHNLPLAEVYAVAQQAIQSAIIRK